MGNAPPGLDLHGCRILVAEDSTALRLAIVHLLVPTCATCIEIADGTRLAELLRTTAVDLVISDVRMPGRNGVDVLQERRSDGDTTPFILVTGAPDAATVRGLEPAVFLAKPFTREELFAAVRDAVGVRDPTHGPKAAAA